MMRSRIRQYRVLALTLLSIFSLLGAALVAASPADASTMTTKSHDFSQGYSKTIMTRFYSPDICVKTQFQGVINFRGTFHTWKRDFDTLYTYTVDNVNLSQNTLTFTTFKPNGPSCTTTRKNYVTLRAKFKVGGYSCSMNPNFSVSVPWSVGISFWPDCGNKELAGWAYTDTDGGSYFKMSKTNNRVNFGGSETKNWSPTKSSNLTWGCTGVAADVRPATGTAVDEKTTSKGKICPNWNGSTLYW